MMPNKKHRRGTSLIEAMAAMAVLLLGAGGTISAQLMVVKHNQYAQRLAEASALLSDFQGNVERWSYTDSRLTTSGSLTSFATQSFVNKWDMGTDTATYSPSFSDSSSDTIATTPNALGTTYQGLTSTKITRYWNVYSTDLSNSGTADGKLVQIIVRWREPGYGFRQITGSAFKRNPAKVF